MRRKGEIMERAEKIQKLCLKMNVSEQEADAALRACGEDILDAALYLEALGRVRMPSGGAYSETPNMERGPQPQPQPAPAYEPRPAAPRVEDQRTAHQQLLNETTQMRAQLDDYEDNLTEVSDKMQQTNQVLNIVLIVLIVVLIAVLGLVIYWILLSKGIL